MASYNEIWWLFHHNRKEWLLNDVLEAWNWRFKGFVVFRITIAVLELFELEKQRLALCSKKTKNMQSWISNKKRS